MDNLAVSDINSNVVDSSVLCIEDRIAGLRLEGSPSIHGALCR